MRKLIFAALAATALASPASALDWNGSGFPLDHRFHTFFGVQGGGGYGGGLSSGGDQRVITIPYDDEAAARAKATRDARICAPVILYTDEGRITHPALGCRR